MCGIAGILPFNSRLTQEDLETFTLSLHHRGPDSHSTYLDPHVGLGHTRLAILDLSAAGACPMEYIGKDGRKYLITFNGEVYNFIEIRAELKSLGYTFKSETDTEVIVAAFDHWGEDCQLRFNGMWAFAIWDAKDRSLFLSRDRFGVKPLYYMVDHRFSFASEIKAFLKLYDFTPQLNEQMAQVALSNPFHYEGIYRDTMIKGIQRLPGGHSIHINAQGNITVKRWWDTLAHIQTAPDDYDEQVEMFRDIFMDAVKIRMRADVPIGTCLSGGVDSSAIASAMFWVANNQGIGERFAPGWQNALIAEFAGTFLDESKYANEVVKHTGAKAVRWNFDLSQSMSLLQDSVWAVEEIYPGISIPQWAIYREMRRNNITVSLDGHGGDELLCGYTWYLDWLMKDVNQNLYKDFHYLILPAILRNYDRCSAAHGIEVRMPIMDWRVVTFSFSLPAESKIGAGRTKRILRDAMKGIMPESIRSRTQKIGFNSPVVDCFNSGMNGIIEQVMNHRLWNDNPFFDGKKISGEILPKVKAAAFTHADWDTVLNTWAKMNFVMWHMLFIDQSSELG